MPRLHKKIMISHIQTTEGISNNIILAFDIYKFRAIFFKQKSPMNNLIGIKMFVYKGFMIRIYLDLMAKKDIAIFFKCFDNT